MKKVMFFATVVFIPMLLYAVVDVDTVFLWDNDRGVSRQEYPAIGVFLLSGYNWSSCVSQDSRYGDYDIFMRYVRPGGMGTTYPQLSVDSFNRFQQTMPDIECNPFNRYVAVWEESLYIRGKEQPTAIYARRYGTAYQPFLVYQNSVYTSKNPTVACRNNGWFVISFTRNFRPPTSIPSISCAVFDSLCNVVDQFNVRDRDSLWSRPPISRVAYCDSGFVVVYEDSSKDGTRRSIYLSYYDIVGKELKTHVKVSNPSGDVANEEYPAVSVDPTGFGVIAWEDKRKTGTAPDIYCRTFQMKPRDGTIELFNEIIIDENELPETRPRVTVLTSKDFYVVYIEKRSDNDIMGRGFLGGSLKPKMTICGDALDQLFPDIDTRKGCDTFAIVWQSDEAIVSKGIPGKYYNVRCQFFYSNKEFVYPCDTSYSFVPDTSGGKRGWYFDDENYDNPATAWNEDPIDEPDSIYADLDFAIMDQLMELNTNGQYFVETADTLPFRKPQKDLAAYEAIFMDLGYRTELTSAGTMTQGERDALYAYYRANNPTMIEGTDFGLYYDTTQLFKAYGADFKGDGAPYLTGNVDTLFGENSFKDETLLYNYQSVADNYVDSISPRTDYELILKSSGAPSRWMTGRCVGWGTYWKDGSKRADKVDSFTVYSTVMLSSIRSETHPHTYAEIYRRLLGYLGLTCQPAPITAIICSTSAEGAIMLKWQVVSDNSPTESAEGPYKLKFDKEKMTSESEFISAPEYYQTWSTADSEVGDWRRQIVYGLPPTETLVTALKVSDEDTLWDALGAEPQVVVGGDSLTPHYIYMGAGYGYFKDFSTRYEYIHRRRQYDSGTDYDSLFVTWNASNLWIGFSRCSFISEGNLFIYLDTKAGGADSTVPYPVTTGRSRFLRAASDSFTPDYCFMLEENDSIIYYEWISTKGGRATYWDTNTAYSWSGYYYEDDVVNNYMYTEIRIPFARMGYTAGTSFKLVVLVQDEATNYINNAYPIFNPLGTNRYVTQYYSWGASGLASGVVPARRQIIGIEEISGLNQNIEPGYLTATPNPFSVKTKIILPAVPGEGVADVSLKIYDITGRLVRSFALSAMPYTLSFSWDGTDDEGRSLPGGIYFCEHAVAEKKEAIKIIYIK